MNNKDNKKIAIIIVIIVISLALLLGIGYFVSQVFSNKNTTNNTDNSAINNNDNSNKIKNISLANKVFQQFVAHEDYLEMVKNNFSNDYKTIVAIENTNPKSISQISCTELFKDDNYKVDYDSTYYSRIDNEQINGFCNYDDSINSIKVYSYDDVNTTYYKMFGESNAIKNIIDLKLYYEGIDIYAYSTSQDSYIPLDCNCGGMGNQEEYYIYDGYTLNDELHIVFGFFAYFIGDVKSSTVTAQTGINKNISLNIETNYSNDYYEIININKIFENQKDKFDLYEMILTKNNNDYIFKSLNKVNG